MLNNIHVLALLGLILLVCSPADAYARSETYCARAKVLSSPAACEGVKIGFDLSDCGHQPNEEIPKPEIVCDGDHATAAIKLGAVGYVARIGLEKNWGETFWAVTGRVERLSLRDTDEIMSEARSVAPKHATAENEDLEGKESGEGKTGKEAKHKTGHGAEAKHGTEVGHHTGEHGSDAEHEAETETERPRGQFPESRGSSLGNGLTIGAFLDLYYAYNFNRPAPTPVLANTTSTSASLPPANNALRFYDLYNNTIGLNLAEITLKRTSSEVGMLIDLDFGHEADLNAAVNPGTGTQVVDEVSKHVGQAYLTYNPSWAPKLRLDAGKLITHMGLEVAKSKENFQYSRSLLYSFGIPIWHMGAHVAYTAVPDRLQLSAYVYNGWNSIYESNTTKTFGGQLKFTPGDLVLVYNLITGPEQPNDDADWRTVHEIYGTWETGRLTLAFDAIYGKEKNVTPAGAAAPLNATWWAVTIAPKFQLMPKLYVSPRFEIYKDKDGFTLQGPPQTIYSYTLTGGLMVADGLELRLEFRDDHSTSATRFVTTTAVPSNQFTSLVALLYSF